MGKRKTTFTTNCRFFENRSPPPPPKKMNVLTQIKNQRAASLAEAKAGVPDTASWHARFSHSAYIFVGGLPPSLTEGDLLAVFAQYGEVVDVHLVK